MRTAAANHVEVAEVDRVEHACVDGHTVIAVVPPGREYSALL